MRHIRKSAFRDDVAPSHDDAGVLTNSAVATALQQLRHHTAPEFHALLATAAARLRATPPHTPVTVEEVQRAWIGNHSIASREYAIGNLQCLLVSRGAYVPADEIYEIFRQHLIGPAAYAEIARRANRGIPQPTRRRAARPGAPVSA